MENPTTIQEIVQRLDKLTPMQQKQILNSVLFFRRTHKRHLWEGAP